MTKAGLAGQISASSVLRILAEHPIKPWQYQSWIYPRDPDLAALDVHTGTVPSAATPKTTGIAPFMALISQVMSAEPYRSAPRVFVIVDNGSDHRGKKAARRLRDAYPNAIMIHTPVHASWLNQVEIFFSIIQKKVISPNDFTSTSQLAATLTAFTDRYNQTARPFNWKFTAADLACFLDQINVHQEPASLPEAA